MLVEAPSYDRSILILQRAGADVVGIPVDGDGIDTDALAAELERETPAFLYVIPNFQNPSGATMTLERRRRVLELAASTTSSSSRTIPTACCAGRASRTRRSSSSTSVTAWSRCRHSRRPSRPACASATSVAPEELATAIGKYAENTYISPCMVSQAGLAAYCQAGYFEPGVERAKLELKARCDAMVEAVRAHFPAGARMVVPQGGYFLWIDLGPGRRHHGARRARGRGRRAVRQGRRLLRRRRRHDVACAWPSPRCRPIASARASSASAQSSPRG